MTIYPDMLARAKYLAVIRLAKYLGVKAPKRAPGQNLQEYRSHVRGLVWQAITRDGDWRATPIPQPPGGFLSLAEVKNRLAHTKAR